MKFFTRSSEGIQRRTDLATNSDHERIEVRIRSTRVRDLDLFTFVKGDDRPVTHFIGVRVLVDLHRGIESLSEWRIGSVALDEDREHSGHDRRHQLGFRIP